MKLKKLTILSIIPAFLLCGCNKNEQQKEYWKDTGHLTYDEAGNVIFDDVEITLKTICDSLDANAVEGLVGRFNRLNTGITVNFSKEGQGSYYSNLARQISQDLDTVPELCMFHNERLPSLQESHLFQPIDRIYDKLYEKNDETLDLSDFYENTKQNNIIDGTLYGLPLDAHSEVVLYRKDLLNKYSISVPTNYNEFVAAAKKIQTGERATNEKFYGASIPTQAFGVYQYAFNSAIFQNGGSIIDSDLMPNWDKEPAVKKACVKMHDLFYGDNQIAKTNVNADQTDAEFTGGNTAFAFVFTWNVEQILNLMYGSNYLENGDWGIMSMSNLFAEDTSKDYAKQQFGISHSFAIPSTIKDITKKAAACYFAKWYAYEASASWSEAGHVPQNKKVVESSSYKDSEMTKKITNFYGAPESFRNFPKTRFYSETSGPLQSIFLAMVDSPNPDYDSIISVNASQAKNIIQSTLD